MTQLLRVGFISQSTVINFKLSIGLETLIKAYMEDLTVIAHCNEVGQVHEETGENKTCELLTRPFNWSILWPLSIWTHNLIYSHLSQSNFIGLSVLCIEKEFTTIHWIHWKIIPFCWLLETSHFRKLNS